MGKKWALIIILSLPVWLVCGVAIGVNYSDTYKARDNPHYYDEVNLSLSKGDLFVQSLMAGGTFLLLIATVYAVIMANRTSAEALKANTEASKQTRRSVEAYIMREKGFISLEELSVSSDNSTVHVTIANRGPTAIYISTFDYYFQESDEDNALGPDFNSAAIVHAFLRPDGTLRTDPAHDGNNFILLPLVINTDMRDKVELGYRLMVTLCYSYESQFGVHDRAITAFISKGDEPSFSVVYRPNLTFDKPSYWYKRGEGLI